MNLGGLEVRNPPAGKEMQEMWVQEGSGYPLQYSSLENPMDRGVLQTIKSQPAKNQT